MSDASAPSPSAGRRESFRPLCGCVLLILVGLLCAWAAGSAVWLLMPPKYSAHALLQVASESPKLVFDSQQRSLCTSDAIYKSTQAELLRSRTVLMAALRKPEVARIRAVQNEVDPVTWLANRLVVQFPNDSDIMSVGLTGKDPNEVAALLGAVVQGYFDEVVDRERTERQEQLSALDRVYTDRETDLRNRRNNLKRLADTLGTGDADAVTLRQKFALEQFAQTRSELSQVQSQLLQAEIALKVQQSIGDKNDQKKAADERDVKVRVLAKEKGRLEAELAAQKADVERMGNSSVELEMMRAEIEQSSRVLSDIAQHREELRVELRAEPRVTLVQRADVPKGPSNAEQRAALAVAAMVLGLVLPLGCLVVWRLGQGLARWLFACR